MLDDAFAALLSRPLPETWRADIAAMRAEMAANIDWDAIGARRARLVSERERLKFQHRNGLMTDADLLREADPHLPSAGVTAGTRRRRAR